MDVHRIHCASAGNTSSSGWGWVLDRLHWSPRLATAIALGDQYAGRDDILSTLFPNLTSLSDNRDLSIVTKPLTPLDDR